MLIFIIMVSLYTRTRGLLRAECG